LEIHTHPETEERKKNRKNTDKGCTGSSELYNNENGKNDFYSE
jgi:hypothetical protein